MSTGNFDRQSAVRIARTVLAVEGSNPVPTKRQRRSPLPLVPAGLQIVRLLESIPGASWTSTVGGDFYQRIKHAMIEREAARLQDLAPAEIKSIIDSIPTTGMLRPQLTVGSGLAVTVELSIDSSLAMPNGGRIDDIVVTYGEVVTVYNAHPDLFNIEDSGGVFGNEAGSLGAGFCTAKVGPDGELWLVNTDRKILVSALTNITDLLDQTSVLDDWTAWFTLLYKDFPEVVNGVRNPFWIWREPPPDIN